MRSAADTVRCDGQTLGLVPTMGYLHEGHISLVRAARTENDRVVVSNFVNPAQFGPREDLDRYPRDLDRDRAICEREGADLLFTPSSTEMYPEGTAGQMVWVEPGVLAQRLCGASRPGHFRGVATVVAKLFNIVQPDRAYFGQKDAQQATIITRMARELAFRTSVRVLPTVREPDGLALSSRNVNLSPQERTQAVALSRALQAAQQAILEGERDAAAVEEIMRRVVAESAPQGRLDYAEVVDLHALQPVTRLDRDILLAIAVYFSRARLIDNTVLRFSDGRFRVP